jgi:hypothetical protein
LGSRGNVSDGSGSNISRSSVDNWSLVRGCWRNISGCWRNVSGCRRNVSGCWRNVSGCFVGRGSVNRSDVGFGFVLGLDEFRVFGLTFVGDGGDVSVLVGSVVDDLSASVGENDAVGAADYVTVAFLGEGEIGVRFFVLDVITKSVGAGIL